MLVCKIGKLIAYSLQSENLDGITKSLRIQNFVPLQKVKGYSFLIATQSILGLHQIRLAFNFS